MAKVEGVRLVAHGMLCDAATCEVILPMQSTVSRPPGYYVVMRRVTEANHEDETDELFFHTKDCMLEALKWQASALMHRRLR
jgi:hypothetical protein